MKYSWLIVILTLLALWGVGVVRGGARTEDNLLPDPSIDEAQAPNRFGVPYRKWGGWVFEGTGVFRNGKVAHQGMTCAELLGAPGAKFRLYSPAVTAEPGRYRFSCWIRGLDIGVHAWGLSEDVNFA